MFCPQYETKEPAADTPYYTPNPGGTISRWLWKGRPYDHNRLKCYNVYLKSEDAANRVAWNLHTVLASPTISVTPDMPSLLQRAAEILEAHKKAGRTTGAIDACVFALLTGLKEPVVIKFPQPESVALEIEAPYYTVDTTGEVSIWYWYNNSDDKKRLDNHKLYLTAEAAIARFEWDLQEAKKRTVPAWFRALGPRTNIEYRDAVGTWCPLFETFMPLDWTYVLKADFRVKPDWLAELGPEVEVRVGTGIWKTYIPSDFAKNHDELRIQGVLFRAKRKPVVKEINGI
jgi:hypothetical protein